MSDNTLSDFERDQRRLVERSGMVADIHCYQTTLDDMGVPKGPRHSEHDGLADRQVLWRLGWLTRRFFKYQLAVLAAKALLRDLNDENKRALEDALAALQEPS